MCLVPWCHHRATRHDPSAARATPRSHKVMVLPGCLVGCGLAQFGRASQPPEPRPACTDAGGRRQAAASSWSTGKHQVSWGRCVLFLRPVVYMKNLWKRGELRDRIRRLSMTRECKEHGLAAASHMLGVLAATAVIDHDITESTTQAQEDVGYSGRRHDMI